MRKKQTNKSKHPPAAMAADSPSSVTPKSSHDPDQHVTIRHSANAITISYSDPAFVLPHLLDIASQFAGRHFASASLTSDDDVLGTSAARQIVQKCANSDCWDCTLGDLKLDSNTFQSCVFQGIEDAGYFEERTNIPATQSTQLYTVVMAIQNAKKKV
ncbi:MAG TPA: hypothetical protein VGD64_01990 [Acidisarcina sp.]